MAANARNVSARYFVRQWRGRVVGAPGSSHSAVLEVLPMSKQIPEGELETQTDPAEAAVQRGFRIAESIGTINGHRAELEALTEYLQGFEEQSVRDRLAVYLRERLELQAGRLADHEELLGKL